MSSFHKKPWGGYEVLLDSETYKVKRITVDPYQQFSLQYHNKRIEHWVIVEGGGKVIVNNSEHIALPRSSWYIKEKSIHRATAASDGLVFIETQIGECHEDDIVRIQDDYGRVT
jgi:mannose-6-phosphate isomerase-like protein (cupin superfamily)